MTNDPNEHGGHSAGENQPSPPIPTNKGNTNEAQPNQQIRVFHNLRPSMETILVLAGIVGLVIGLKSWQESTIESAVKKVLQDETTLRKIASQAQPMLIFDPVGGIISDSGGLAYIDRVIASETRGDGLPSKIIIRPKRLLSQPPYISILDGANFEYTTQRGPEFDWEYTIARYTTFASWDAKSARFRLEIFLNP